MSRARVPHRGSNFFLEKVIIDAINVIKTNKKNLKNKWRVNIIQLLGGGWNREKLRDIRKENVMLLQCWDIRIRLKVKNLFPSCEGRQVVPKKYVIELRQGHRTTVFCKISVRRSKNCLQFQICYLRKAKNFQMAVPFMYSFRSLSN